MLLLFRPYSLVEADLSPYRRVRSRTNGLTFVEGVHRGLSLNQTARVLVGRCGENSFRRGETTARANESPQVRAQTN